MSTINTGLNAAPGCAPRRGLHVALWIAQWIVAVVFVLSGITKLATPIDESAR